MRLHQAIDVVAMHDILQGLCHLLKRLIFNLL